MTTSQHTIVIPPAVDESGDARFYTSDVDPDNWDDVVAWNREDVLVTIVDSEAGVIGYTHRSRVHQFMAALDLLATTHAVSADGEVAGRA